MPIKIGSDGKIETLGIVKVKVQQTKQSRTKKKKSKDAGVSRGPKNCPYAKLIEKETGLYECSMWLYHSDSDTLDEEWTPVRIREGAELCVDCNRRPHIIEK